MRVFRLGEVAAVAAVAALFVFGLVWVFDLGGSSREPAAPLVFDDVPPVSRPSTTTTTTTSTPTTTAPVASSTTTTTTSTTTTTTGAVTIDELAAIIAETNPAPEILVVDGPDDVDGPVTPDVGPTPLPKEVVVDPVVVTLTTDTTIPEDETTTTTTTAGEPEGEPLPPTEPIPEETEPFVAVNPLGPDIEWGATEPVRLVPGMALTTTATDLFYGVPYDGAEIIGIVFANNSADEIMMYVCIDYSVLSDKFLNAYHDHPAGENIVGDWRLARTDIPDYYRLLNEPTGGTSTSPWVRERWEASGLGTRLDVSGCW